MDIVTFLGDLRFLETDLILGCVYRDERPPQGLSGKIDWLLHGQLSDLLAEGRFSGQRGSFALLATQEKIASPKFMLAGMGDRDQVNSAALAGILPAVAERLAGLKLRSAALEVIGDRAPKLGAGEAARTLIEFFSAGASAVATERLLIVPRDETEKETVVKILW